MKTLSIARRLVLAGSLACAGCYLFTPHDSSFLGDCSRFERRDDGSLAFLDPRADLSAYERVLLEQVSVFPDPHVGQDGVHPGEVAELVARFRRSLLTALDGHYERAMEAGPDVLEVRVAVTNVAPAGRAAAGPGDEPAAGLGEASIEAELVDSVTKMRVAALVDSTHGKNLLDGEANAARWEEATAAFDAWALDLREFLDRAHGR